ncbi:cytochrome P450-domain-containing protein [Aspergillus coremiiformis]|uniref:Benzoate 4-monooxygenase bphA n=1 Tax=Aspergillus coremiiformis TaxID=138285 RepID=A0A5N6ZBF4_9EURO|nr:cytochrome P450-domain-containing protein [Aspergillus coremiiformis]
MSELLHSALSRCPPRQARRTRLNTIIEDSREGECSESPHRSEPGSNKNTSHPQLKLKTSGLAQASRLYRLLSPLSGGTTSSCSDMEWQNQMQSFDDLYDATDEESEMSDECTSISSTRPTSLVSPASRNSISPTSRNRYPRLTIPSSTTWSSLQGAPKSSPIPPTPPPKIPVSPAVLSMLGNSVPAVHAPPSLDGSVSSDQISTISAPVTPDVQSLPGNGWDAHEILVRPELEGEQNEDLQHPETSSDLQSIAISVENSEEDWQQFLGNFPRILGRVRSSSVVGLVGEVTPSDSGVFLPEDALATLRHIPLDGTPDPWSETSEKNDEMWQVETPERPRSAGDATPASDLSGYSFSRLSIPSPGGFFASLGPRARHTWSIPKLGNVPSSATAERFYNLPFIRTNGEIIEQIVECPGWAADEQLTAVYDPNGPPTAIKVPNEDPSLQLEEHTKSPVSDDVDAVCEIAKPGMYNPDERDENYESELQNKAMASLDRTSVWLAAQASYLAALCETNPANTPVSERDDHIDTAGRIAQAVSQIVCKKAVRFDEAVPDAPSSQPSALASKDSIYWRGFQSIRQRSSNADTFLHRNMRFDAVQSIRLGLTNMHTNCLIGSYELVCPERPPYRGPFSQAPRNSVIDSVIEEKAQFSMLEKEQFVLTQISEPMWAMDALRYLNGGHLIASPAFKKLHKGKSPSGAPRISGPRHIRVLDLGGHASCEWAWNLAHDYPNVKVYTVFTKHQVVNCGIKGPANHRLISVQNLWELPFPDNKFDVISARSLPVFLKSEWPSGKHQDEYDLCLRECRRCLKPGGYFEFFMMDAQISRAGPYASATSLEFTFNLQSRGYDPNPTKSFLKRLQRGGFVGTKRAWMFLPMGNEPVISPVPRETPEPRVKSQISECEAVQGPVGSTSDAASVTGLFGGWVWEQWLLKLQIEMGREQGRWLEGIGSVFDEGRKNGAGWTCFFFKTLTNQTVIIELKNDIRIRGTLKSVDQYLNIKLDDVDVLDLDKYPHLSSVKNMFIRGSVVRYKADGPPKATSRQSRITQFATKAERPSRSGNSSTSLRREDSSTSNGGGRLFLDDRNGKKSALIDLSTPPRSRSRTPDDIWGEEPGDLAASKEEEERYNENGSAVKKRRVESESDSREDQVKDEAPAATLAPAKSRQVTGPFIDESDNEEDLGTFGNFGDEPAVLKEAEPEETDATDVHDDRKDNDRTSDVAVPPLVREATSHIEDDKFANFDDLEANEFNGEELLDEDNEDDGPEEIVFGFDDSNDSTALEDCDVYSGGGTTVCPICQVELVGLSEVDVSVHVNDCLDGKPTTVMPKPKADIPVKTPTSADLAAIAKPPQSDPYSGTSKTASAFSKLMAGNAEDTAWTVAAASEVKSRGKQAYQRTCPFYKIIPGFSICVDAFRYGAVEGCSAYFLSHFHSDHYIGLTASWRHGPIYCSKATGNLVRQQLKVNPRWLIDLEFEKTTEVPSTGGVQVTLIEANHCPGSAIFLFEKAMGAGPLQKVHRVLHCGDFRASPTHVQHALLRPEIVEPATGQKWQQRIDVCYLDTTYLSPKYSFPSQPDVIKACADLCARLDRGGDEGPAPWQFGKATHSSEGLVSKFFHSVTGSSKSQNQPSRPQGRLLVVIGTYSIGKERLCLAIARALKSKIYATAGKQRVCACLEDAELSTLLTDDPVEAQVHMQTLFEIRAETLTDYLDSMKPHFSQVVGFRPTGWTYRPPSGRMLDNPPVSTVLHSAHWKTPFTTDDLVAQRGSTRESACFGVPYSEHSSFRELTMFCCALRIGRVIPTVNVGSRKSRERMKAWVERWEAEKRKSTMIAALLSPTGAAYALVAALVVCYLAPYLRLCRLRDIPSPGLAAFSNLWLFLQARKGKRFLAVDSAHQKYGKLVRIAPRQISIADDEAIQAIYGHGNGFLKADFYDAFVSIRRGLFNTRDRAEHSRKRKALSHTFSAKSVGQFEQYIHANVELFVEQWSRLIDTRQNPRTGYATVDALHWFNYLAFDIIGDLAFGAPFGMLEKGRDITEMRKSADAAPQYVRAVEVLNRRGEVAATLGACPSLIPWAKYIPDRFFRNGLQAVEHLSGIAVARVNERLRPEVMANSTRVDLLARLMQGKDASGNQLGREELTVEALTQLIAGSDTTSNTSCAILYWCLRTSGVVENLHRVLDEAIPKDVQVPTHAMVKDIPYLQWIIWETMRIHSPSAMGLPREIPQGNPPVTISGHTFYPGDVLSVPSYTIHRSKAIWGPDADEFVPERWDATRLTARQKAAFIPFSTGPRACVGRNVAEMELFVICGTVFRLFDMVIQQDGPMETREGFLRKPVGLVVGMKRRAVV